MKKIWKLLPVLVCLTALAQTEKPAAEVNHLATMSGSEREVRAFMAERRKASKKCLTRKGNVFEKTRPRRLAARCQLR